MNTTPNVIEDPLLVGVDRIDGEYAFYLVAKFDLTPAESYITQEFIELPKEA